jgi:hypothetical protein
MNSASVRTVCCSLDIAGHSAEQHPRSAFIFVSSFTIYRDPPGRMPMARPRPRSADTHRRTRAGKRQSNETRRGERTPEPQPNATTRPAPRPQSRYRYTHSCGCIATREGSTRSTNLTAQQSSAQPHIPAPRISVHLPGRRHLGRLSLSPEAQSMAPTSAPISRPAAGAGQRRGRVAES